MINARLTSYSRFVAAVSSLVVSVLLASPAHGDPIQYQLEGVTFSDGGTASGTFTIDSNSPFFALVSYNITTTAGSVVPGGGV